MRQAIKQLDHANGVGRERPSQPGDELSQWEQDEAEDDCQAAEHHHAGLAGRMKALASGETRLSCLKWYAMIGSVVSSRGEGQQHELAQRRRVAGLGAGKWRAMNSTPASMNGVP